MDMYKKDFVVAVKVDGQIMREKGEEHNEIHLPFGCEYSLLFKNLRAQRVAVSVEIDGQDVLDGGRLVIEPNSEAELERFVEDLSKGNRFRFIKKTQQIQEYRGDRIDDGIIRIEFQYEKPVPEIVTLGIGPSWKNPYSVKESSVLRSSIDSFYDVASYGKEMPNLPMEDEGITVKGSESKQKFTLTTLREMEREKHIITFKLKGFTDDNKKIEKPITVKTKLTCTTCGTKNKSGNNYCSSCGTHL